MFYEDDEDYPFLLDNYGSYRNRNESHKDPTSVIPKKIMLEVFSYLQISDLGHCSSVNKRWKQLAADDQLWKRLYTRDYVELETEFAHYKYEYWKRLIEFNSKDDFTEYLKDNLTKRQKEKISCWHLTLHNVGIDVVGYFLFFLFTVLVSLKMDDLVMMGWIYVFLPLFFSFLFAFFRIFSIIPYRMAMMKHGFSTYNPHLTRKAGFIYCFAHHHRAKMLARLHLLVLIFILFLFFLFSFLKVVGHIKYWSESTIPLIIFLIGLIQTSLCGFGTPQFKRSGRLIFLLFLVPIELLIILTCLRLDEIIKWNWWIVTFPSWFLYVFLSFLFLLTWMKVLKDSIFTKKQGCCNVFYSGLVMFLFSIAIFGPIILFQLMSIIRAEYNWKIHYWIISIPLFVQEIFILPLAYTFWKKYY